MEICYNRIFANEEFLQGTINICPYLKSQSWYNVQTTPKECCIHIITSNIMPRLIITQFRFFIDNNLQVKSEILIHLCLIRYVYIYIHTYKQNNYICMYTNAHIHIYTLKIQNIMTVAAFCNELAWMTWKACNLMEIIFKFK